MHVMINGEMTRLEQEEPLSALLDRRNLHPLRVAVEVNEELVSRRDFDKTRIRDGDRIEIVTLVGGG